MDIRTSENMITVWDIDKGAVRIDTYAGNFIVRPNGIGGIKISRTKIEDSKILEVALWDSGGRPGDYPDGST